MVLARLGLELSEAEIGRRLGTQEHGTPGAAVLRLSTFNLPPSSFAMSDLADFVARHARPYDPAIEQRDGGAFPCAASGDVPPRA